MNISIIGLGLIGGSIALDLRESGFATNLIGVDQNHEHCQQALKLGLVDHISVWPQAVKESDLVILAIPVNAIVHLLPELMSHIGDRTTVTDMGSTKAQITACLIPSTRAHSRRGQFVASHPMAGTEHSGPTAALRGLFVGRTAVICDQHDSHPRDLKRIEELYQVLKMRLVYMSSQEHDLHAAYVSHLSHISSFVLANTVLGLEKNVGTIFDLAGGGFESTVRLAKSSPEMWAPIFEQNREHVVEALSAYIDELEAFRESLVSKDFAQTKSFMQEANHIRRVLEKMHGVAK